MKIKLLEISKCKDCYYLKYNKYTKPKAFCAVMSPDKEIDVDITQYLPTWCPLPDKKVIVNDTRPPMVLVKNAE